MTQESSGAMFHRLVSTSNNDSWFILFLGGSCFFDFSVVGLLR